MSLPAKNIKIYVLRDPTDYSIRYLGKTKCSLRKRLLEHLKYNGKDHRSFWIQSLLNKDLEPIIEQVDLCYEAEWREKERRWIRQCKLMGFDLTNGTEGGDGCSGWRHTEESKANLSKALKGRVFTEEWKTKISKKAKERCNNPEFKAKLSIARKGKKPNLSDELREKKRQQALAWNEKRWRKIREAKI